MEQLNQMILLSALANMEHQLLLSPIEQASRALFALPKHVLLMGLHRLLESIFR
jgi:hypothetical protein